MQQKYIAIILTTAIVLLSSAAFFHNNIDNVSCVSRSTMISRGQDWVNKKVPYSQNATHDGYRTDCSGFVSMCWELAKPGLHTWTMHEVAHNISKNDQQAGDAMNCQQHHIMLFVGWSDSGKTHYTAMQQSNPTYGTIKVVVPYPYWNGSTCFHPIRYNSVC